MADAAESMPFRSVGRYELVRHLGRGGMGEVFEGRHLDLGTRVAIKVMHPSSVADGRAVRRVVREGRAVASIKHPNVVTVLDVGVHETPFLVMELLVGTDLRTHLAQEAPLSVQATVDLVLPIASAIAAAHDAGIVHRDLKPSNVVLANRHGRIEPVVVDFGISKTLGHSNEHSVSERLVGTVQYMAPEQLRRAQEISPRSDGYALGVLLYECLTGGTPFWSDDYYELLHAIMTAKVVAPSVINPAIPRAFEAVILRAMAREPHGRYPDVRALGAGVLAFASAETRRKWAPEFGQDEAALSLSVSPRLSLASWPPPTVRGSSALVLGLGLATSIGFGIERAVLRAHAGRAVESTPFEDSRTFGERSGVAFEFARFAATPSLEETARAPDRAPDPSATKMAAASGGTKAPAHILVSAKVATQRAVHVQPAPVEVAHEQEPSMPSAAPPPREEEHPIERGTRNIPIVE